jgi:hypothetical protein
LVRTTLHMNRNMTTQLKFEFRFLHGQTVRVFLRATVTSMPSTKR